MDNPGRIPGWREQKFRVKSGDISGYKIFIHHLIHHKNFT